MLFIVNVFLKINFNYFYFFHTMSKWEKKKLQFRGFFQDLHLIHILTEK
jgi:hypothetical protein